MDKYDRFKEKIKKSAEAFKKINKKETIRLISHFDCDGISSCSILIKAFNRENRKYTVSIIQQINEEFIESLRNDPYNVFVFSDLGSSYADHINSVLKGKTVFILDHHELKNKENYQHHINPHFFDIEGNKEISGAGIAYLFARALNKKNKDVSHIAIIGAIGDIQEENGFLRLNDEILQDAKEMGIIKVQRGLRVFGGYTRPLYKVLEYSTDINIPGVTGSETNSIKFLQDINIDPKIGKTWRKLIDLSDKEMQKLITAIVIKRNNQPNPENVVGYSYILLNETISELKEVKQFSTVLNSCGRLNNASLGIGCCIGDEKQKRKAIKNLNDYKKLIGSAMNWYYNNKDSSKIITKEKYIIINAEDNILGTMAGTIASMLSRNNEFKEGTLIMAMAQQIDNTTKVSLRSVGKNEHNLMEVMKKVAESIGAESGGHKDAAGAIFKTEDEDKFINEAKKILNKISLEESIK